MSVPRTTFEQAAFCFGAVPSIIKGDCFRRRSHFCSPSKLTTSNHDVPPPRLTRRRTLPIASSSSSSSSSLRTVKEGVTFSMEAVTIVLSLKMKTHISISDTRAILSEYARMTLREPDVLRCDVMYEVTKKDVAVGPFYQVWTTFYNSQAYMQHERTPHAAKLRIYIDSRDSIDTASLLTKLAYDAFLLRPIFPILPGWRSSLEHGDKKARYDKDTSSEVKGPKRKMQSPLLSDALEQTFMTEEEVLKKRAQRALLNSLITNVGAEDVKIQVSQSFAVSSDAMRILRVQCEDYLKEMEQSAGIIRTGLLIDKSNPLCIVLVSVHDPTDRDGIFFESDLGADYITDDGWMTKRFKSIFPDKIGWEKYIDDEEAIRLGFVASSTDVIDSASPSTEKFIASLVKQSSNTLSTAQPNAPTYRLLYGCSAFNDLKQYVREFTGKASDQDVKLVFFSGWNPARLHPLLDQLDPRDSDTSRYNYKFGLQTTFSETTIKNIRQGIEDVKQSNADGILTYGGGSTIDMGKIVSRLVNCSPELLESTLAQIQDGINNDVGILKLDIGRVNPFPLLVIPSALGPGVEMTDSIIIRDKVRDKVRNSRDAHPQMDNDIVPREYLYGLDEWRSLYIVFEDSEDNSDLNKTVSKTVLIDSRLCSPRRLSALCAAQAALSNTCAGIDAFLSCQSGSAPDMMDSTIVANESDGYMAKNSDGERFALQTIGLSYRNVQRAHREFYKSSGESRDALTKACLSLGVSLDTVNRPGIALRLTLAVVDEVFAEKTEHVFRYVLVRVTIALVHVLNTSGFQQYKQLLNQVARCMDVNGANDVERSLLQSADECDVPLLPMTGLPSRKVPYVCQRVSNLLAQGPCNDVERRIRHPYYIRRILKSAMTQRYGM